jgi:hypothetical protein
MKKYSVKKYVVTLYICIFALVAGIVYVQAAENTFETHLDVISETVTPPITPTTPSAPSGSSGSGTRLIINPIIATSQLTNVINFRATPLENSITLNWINPNFSVFDSVRIVRSDKFYPRDIYDGQVVYKGSAETYNDTDVKVGVTYYYSNFAKDSQGNYSSGALAQARIRPAGEIAVTPTSTDPFANISVLKNVHPDIARLSLTDFDFIQDRRKLANIDNTVAIDGSKNLTISLDYKKVPEILKTIAITLIDPKDPSQVFPFLLRVNKDKTAYEAILAPLGRSGKYEMKIIVLDYKNQGLKRLEGSLQAIAFSAFNTSGITGISSLTMWNILLALLIIITLYFASRRKKYQRQYQYYEAQ